MARPRSYDETTALDAAAQLFWSKGYDGTSMSDLEVGMEMGRQSIYNAFGDKHELFVKSLTHYRQSAPGRLSASLMAEGAGWEAIEAYFEAMVDFLTPAGQRRGCLVTNAIVEVGDADEVVSTNCQANQAEVLTGFEHALRNAMNAGELGKSLKVEATARLLMAQTYGVTVLSKNGATRAELSGVVETLLSRIR